MSIWLWRLLKNCDHSDLVMKAVEGSFVQLNMIQIRVEINRTGGSKTY